MDKILKHEKTKHQQFNDESIFSMRDRLSLFLCLRVVSQMSFLLNEEKNFVVLHNIASVSVQLHSIYKRSSLFSFQTCLS